MSGGFFRGTSAEQDTRFSNKQAKLLKTQKFAPELEHLVDMSRVKMDVIKPWIANRVTELLGFEDEVLINFIYGLLDGKEVNGKQVQISLTGFMEKNTGKFMKELWSLLLSAQKNASGVPQQFLDAKEEETRKRKSETDRIANEIQKKKDKESREADQERSRKMDGGADTKASNATPDLTSKHEKAKGLHPEDETGTDERNGVRARKRVSRSPDSVDRSPLSNCGSPSRSISKSFSNSRSHSERRSGSLSRSPAARGRSVSSEKAHHASSPRRLSATPRRRRSPYTSISPSRRRSSYSRQRSTSRSRHRSPSLVRHRFRSPYRRTSPSPYRRWSPSPYRRRSPSPYRRRRSPSPYRRRRSPSPYRRRSPSPFRRRSPPYRRRSPSPYARRSPSPYRHRSPPYRRRSPSPGRRRSPSPARRRRSPSPARRRRSPSPARRHRSPSPARRRSSSQVQRRNQRSPSISWHRSPSPVRRGSLSPVVHGSVSPVQQKSPIHRRSPSPDHKLSPLRSEWSSQSPAVGDRSLSPVRVRSPKNRRVSPVGSSKEKRTHEKLSPARKHPLHVRSPKRDSEGQSNFRGEVQPLSPSPERSPVMSDVSPGAKRKIASDGRSLHNIRMRKGREHMLDDSLSPPRKGREHKTQHDSSETSADDVKYPRDDRNHKSKAIQIKHLSSVSKQRDSSLKYDDDIHSPERSAGHRSVDSRRYRDKFESRKKDQEIRSEISPAREVLLGTPEPHESPKSFKDSRKQASYPEEGKQFDKSCSRSNKVKDSDWQHKSPVSDDNVDHSNRSAKYQSGSEESGKHRSEDKRKHKRSQRQEVTSDDDYSYDSEMEERKEAKRKRKREEKKLRKEEKRRRREERRRRREERRAEKKSRRQNEVSSDGEHRRMESHPSDDEEAESEQKKLEIELRNKALESLKAKKAISH